MRMLSAFLLRISKDPTHAEYPAPGSEFTVENALQLLLHSFPQFEAQVAGKRIADFGCGEGFQSIALATRYRCDVVGIESNPRTLERAIQNAKAKRLENSRILLAAKISSDMLGTFDVVISENAFEHFHKPADVLAQMSSLLKHDGLILITFGPPWLAPYGSHMHFFCKVPWINVLFPESTVMEARSHFRSDGATRYEDVESGLNKMTLRKFESIVASCGLQLEYKKYECVKGLNFLARLPLLREFFVNNVTAILSKRQPRQ